MVRITCLSPTKSYSYCSSAIAHLEILILQTSNIDTSTRSNQRATIQSKQQVQLRTIHQYKEKAQKERTKIQGLLLRLREHKKRGKRS